MVATAKAEPIKFIFTSVGYGSLNTVPFADQLVTVTVDGDTDNILTNVPGFGDDTQTLINGLFTVTVPSVGSDTILENGYVGNTGYVFSSEGAEEVGFGHNGNDLGQYSPAFATYALRSSLGPISGTEFSLSLVTSDFGAAPERYGIVKFTPTGPGSFQSIVGPDATVTPEPSTLSLLSSGLLGAVAVVRWRSLRQPRRLPPRD